MDKIDHIWKSEYGKASNKKIKIGISLVLNFEYHVLDPISIWAKNANFESRMGKTNLNWKTKKCIKTRGSWVVAFEYYIRVLIH